MLSRPRNSEINKKRMKLRKKKDSEKKTSKSPKKS